MNLADYFANHKGLGILGTADDKGLVDMAIYGRPHVIDENTVAFIMRDRLSHRNIVANPNAAYLFRENGDGYNGYRLYLTKIAEETDPAKIAAIRRKIRMESEGENTFLVYFRIDRIRPLVGDEPALPEA
jgi:hypothetical protein